MSTSAIVINYTAKTVSDKPWKCLECTALNDPELINCVVCFQRRQGVGKLSIDELEKHQSITSNKSLATNIVGKVRNMFKSKLPAWNCPNCTLRVESYQMTCTACGHPCPLLRRGSNKSLASNVEVNSGDSKLVRKKSTRAELDNTISSYDIISSVEVTRTHDGVHQTHGDVHLVEADSPPSDLTPSSSPYHHPPPPPSPYHHHSPHPSPRPSPSPSPATSRGHSPTPPSVTNDVTPIPTNSISQPPSSSLPQPVDASQVPPGQSYWPCSLCGAFNFIITPGQHCYICNIGRIPPSLAHPQVPLPAAYSSAHENRDYNVPVSSSDVRQQHYRPHQESPHPDSYNSAYPRNLHNQDPPNPAYPHKHNHSQDPAYSHKQETFNPPYPDSSNRPLRQFPMPATSTCQSREHPYMHGHGAGSRASQSHDYMHGAGGSRASLSHDLGQTFRSRGYEPSNRHGPPLQRQSNVHGPDRHLHGYEPPHGQVSHVPPGPSVNQSHGHYLPPHGYPQPPVSQSHGHTDSHLPPHGYSQPPVSQSHGHTDSHLPPHGYSQPPVSQSHGHTDNRLGPPASQPHGHTDSHLQPHGYDGLPVSQLRGHTDSHLPLHGYAGQPQGHGGHGVQWQHNGGVNSLQHYNYSQGGWGSQGGRGSHGRAHGDTNYSQRGEASTHPQVKVHDRPSHGDNLRHVQGQVHVTSTASTPPPPPLPPRDNVPSVPKNSDPAYYCRTQVPMAQEHVLAQHRLPSDQHKMAQPTSPTDKRARLHRRQSSDNGMCTSTEGQQRSTQHVQAIRREDSLEASQKYQIVQQYCRQHREPFTDPDFPPADRSLYTNSDTTPPSWGVYHWLRPSQIKDSYTRSKVQWTIFRNPGPEDIAQGVLGNCWVLSALAVIAEQPALLQDIMLTKTYSEEGAYQVRLCRDGKWQTVLVDDCFPCYKNNELVFSKARRKQLWVPLIEKALAKLYGSYEALNAGRVLSGLSTLTGLPCEKIYLKKQSLSDEDVDKDLIWAQLLSFRESSCPMGASCGGYEMDQQDYTKVGLEPNHAYSILDVRCVESETSLRLIRLRNPWGKFSWRGNWSDTDPIWRSRARLREQLQPRGGEQGIFWIEFTDFMRYFCEVDVCKFRPDWYSTRVPGSLLTFAPSQYSLLACTVASTTEVDISLYQPSTRGEGSVVNLVDLAVLVLRYRSEDGPSLPLPVSCDLASGSQIQSIVGCSGFLEPGYYAILPLAFNHWDLSTRRPRASSVAAGEVPADSKPYVLALHTSKMVHYQKNAITRPGYLAESIFLLAGRARAKSTPFPGMALLEVCLKHACRILVAVNEDPHYHFTVSCDASDSVNVLSTRGALATVDCIPPMHRQVVMLMTQMETSQSYKVFMKIEFHKSRLNQAGDWGALHSPELSPNVQELHSPRLISS